MTVEIRNNQADLTPRSVYAVPVRQGMSLAQCRLRAVDVCQDEVDRVALQATLTSGLVGGGSNEGTI